MPISELVLVMMGLLTVAMLAASLGRRLPIPYTVFLVVIGVVLSMLADSTPLLSPLNSFQLTPELVFFVFLPALIFESALNLDARQLLKDIAPIFVLAAPALMISTAMIGLGIWYYMELDLTLALLFGALIAATDPVAVVALFKELGAPPRLTTLVEGESLFNDATAIVIFHILLGIALSGQFVGGDVTHAAYEFLRVFFGGIIVGALIGFGIAELMRRIRGSEIAIVTMSIVMAYSSFVIAEHVLHVSGVMAAVSAALSMGVYAVTRIQPEVLHSIHEMWELIALVCNSLLFLMIGLSVDLPLLLGNLDGILIAALLVLVARAATVYSLVPATVRLFTLPHVDMGERHIMWWGGLKGGLAIAIVLSIPETLPGREVLVQLTLGVVLFTLLINAPSIRPLIGWLGLDRMSEEETGELRRGLLEAGNQADAVVRRLVEASLISPDNKARLARQIESTFEPGDDSTVATPRLRDVFAEALQIESDELERLYRLGLVQEYTYLDLRARLRREKEFRLRRDLPGSDDKRREDGLFARAERAALRWLRERNAFAGVLARFQNARLSQGVQRDIATLLCAQAVLDELRQRHELQSDDIETVERFYRSRLERRRNKLSAIREGFPDFFSQLEYRLAHRAALNSASHHTYASQHHGSIGAKAYRRIQRQIERALADNTGNYSTPGRLSAEELLDNVPLFKDLPDILLTELAELAQTVTFLSGDIVIGQNEKGNALYIVMQGTVDVLRSDEDRETRIAQLGQGDFFGEHGLLSDEVRSATVRAATPLSLLRLTRKNVRAIADRNAAIARRLEQANAARA